jgi:hypothetical protein
MRPFRLFAWASALAMLALGTNSAHAAWDNVFQVCCNGCNKPPSSSSYYIAAAPPVVAYAPPTTCCAPPPPPCPTQVCETHYQQRTYYRAEVSYETRYQTEAVTTMQTSYYWEPVTRYRVSSYYDSCSCSYKQVATPIVEQTLRSRCCPVTSYYQRAYAVPVTTMKPYTVAEPVQSCYWTNVPQSNAAQTYVPPANPSVGTPVPTSPGGAGSQEYRQPGTGGAGLEEQRSSPQSNPRVIDQKPFDLYKPMPPASNLKQPLPPGESPKPTLVRTDKFVSLVRSNIEGELVLSDRKPDAGARLVFERRDNADESRTIIVGNDGRFRVSLSDGHWDVFKQLPDGRKIELAPVDVNADLVSPIKLTSR